MPPSKRSREQVDYLHRNPQMDPKRHQANLAIRRDHGAFGLAKREALHADTKTGVLSLQLDCAEACVWPGSVAPGKWRALVMRSWPVR